MSLLSMKGEARRKRKPQSRLRPKNDTCCRVQVIHISCATETHRSNRLVRRAKVWATGVYRWLLRFLFHQLQRQTKWCLSIARNGASPLLPTIGALDGRRIQKRIVVRIVA